MWWSICFNHNSLRQWERREVLSWTLVHSQSSCLATTNLALSSTLRPTSFPGSRGREEEWPWVRGCSQAVSLSLNSWQLLSTIAFVWYVLYSHKIHTWFVPACNPLLLPQHHNHTHSMSQWEALETLAPYCSDTGLHKPVDYKTKIHKYSTVSFRKYSNHVKTKHYIQGIQVFTLSFQKPNKP